MLLEFSQQDILSSKIVDADWYVVEIDRIETKEAKDKKSMNDWIKGHIVSKATGETDGVAGVPTPYFWLINSKGAFAAVGLFNSIWPNDKIETAGTRRDTKALPGNRVEAFIGQSVDENGVLRNTIGSQFRPVGG